MAHPDDNTPNAPTAPTDTDRHDVGTVRLLVAYLVWAGAAAWLVAYTIWLVSSNWAFTTDDAYISLRYAHHVAAGAGLVWNPGEAPVEGYSNLSFVLLGALAESAGVDPVFTLKAAGLCGLLLTLAAMYGIGRHRLGPCGALVAPICLVSYYGTIFWATSGLETAVYQGLVAVACLLFIRGLFEPYRITLRSKPNTSLILASGLALFLASLTRPEAPLFAAIFTLALGWLWLRNKERRADLQAAALYLVLQFGLLLIGYYAWKFHYFGSFLPNSFACKLVETDRPDLLSRRYLELAAVPFLLLPFTGRRHALPTIVLVAPSVIYLVLLYGADPIIAHYNRHALAAFGLVLTAAAPAGLGLLARLLRQPHGRIEILGATIAALALIPAALRYEDRLETYASVYRARMEARERVGAWILEQGGPNASFVVGDAGIISWIAPGPSIDAFCLNNLAMTQEEGGRDPARFAERVLVQQQPDFIVMANRDRKRLDPRPAYGMFPAIVKHPGFADYKLDRIEEASPSDTFHYFVFRRSPAGPPLRAAEQGAFPTTAPIAVSPLHD